MGCQHEDFEAEVAVGRIKPDEDTGVAAFVADVKVKCAHCGAPFGFRGMASGHSWAGPSRSVDALQASLPLLSPSDLALAGPLPGLSADPPPPPMFGFDVRVA